MTQHEGNSAYDAQLNYLATLITKVEEQIGDGKTRMDKFEKALAVNNELTGEIHAMFTAGKGGFKVLGWLGSIVKWAGMIAAGLLALYTALYAVLHGGATPK